MAEDRIPISKTARAGKFLKTGLNVAGDYIGHYGKKAVGLKTTRADLDRKMATSLMDGFTDLRGAALKVAQMMSMDTTNLSPDFTAILQKAQSNVPPMSGPLAVKMFTNEIGKHPEEVFDRFNMHAHKAASLGQVHEAWKDGQKLAVKIQYPGVAESLKSDLQVIRSLARQVAPRFLNTPSSTIDHYAQEVEDRLTEELDYRIELENSIAFSQLCAEVPGIVFPRYYPEYSRRRVLTMEWIEGKHLKEFMAHHPTEADRNRVGQVLWDYFEYQLHVLQRMNTDTHPGNFLFREDGTVGVLDFGSTKVIPRPLYDAVIHAVHPRFYDDPAAARPVLETLELLRPEDTPEDTQKWMQLFRKMTDYTLTAYREGRFRFANPAFWNGAKEIGKELEDTREPRGSKDFLFISRAYLGLFSILRDLDAELDTRPTYLNWG